jgi:pyrroloquinoline quinone (PQQ) biosynthesis protein C
MKLSEMLKQDIEAYVSRFQSTSQLFVKARAGTLTPEAMATYIHGLRHLLRHTDVNLHLARTRAEELGRKELAAFFEHKAHEEKGHDQWADNDMIGLNEKFGVGAPAAPARSISALLEYLREMIDEEPSQYVAYLLFVEYVTVLLGPEWLRLLEERCGIPTSVLTVVDKHVALDVGHVAEGLREIDLLLGNDCDVEQLRGALRTSMQFLDSFCGEISETIH